MQLFLCYGGKKKQEFFILIDISFKGAQKVILLVIYSLNQSDNSQELEFYSAKY